MNPSESMALLQDLFGQELEARPFLVMAMSVLLAVMFFYVLRRWTASPILEGEGIIDPPVEQERVSGWSKPREESSPAAPSVRAHREAAIPQDSVLRRHYIAHIRYMAETVTFSCPTDSVLRRHYDQLIASEVDHCLSDEGHLQKLVRRFEAQKNRM